MAARSVDKKVQPLISQVKKRPSSTSKAERSKRVEIRAQSKSASGQAKKHTDELLAKEEEYKLLNAELEAKTADLVRQAEQLMREQSEVLSNPLSNVLLTDTEEEETSRITKTRTCAVQQPGVKKKKDPVLLKRNPINQTISYEQHLSTVEVTKKSVASRSQNMLSGKQVKDPHFKTESSEDDFEAVEDSANSFLAKTIHSMEEKMNNAVVHENAVDEIPNFGDNVGSGVSEAQIRVLKAKLRIMQEELDQISCEYYKKDDENTKLSAKIKELEEDRARLQKTVSIQQTQIEKHRALAAESNKKCDGLQLEVSGLSKEIENLNRSHKQAAAVHSTVEVRLNRALEEVERLKTQLNKMKQEKKDKITEEHQSRENLLAENKMLKKQKAELIMGFKKQLKLIDILKRQKMHFEAAKLLSFTEEEFMKALDWGKS